MEGLSLDPQAAIDWARGQNAAIALSAYAVVNVIGTSVLPLPIGAAMMVIGGVLFGQVLGLAVYLSTSALGAIITFLIVRSLKDSVIKWLGPHADTWRRLDDAITREGLYICFLWRVAPIAPYVVSSAMISMTNISMWDYTWTTALGIIPSSFPIVSGERETAVCSGLKLASLGPRPYSIRLSCRPSMHSPFSAGAAMAGTYLIENKEMDPLTLTINVLSIGAGIYVMIRLGAIALEVMAKSGMQEGQQAPGSSADHAQPPPGRLQPQTSRPAWQVALPCLGRRGPIVLV